MCCRAYARSCVCNKLLHIQTHYTKNKALKHTHFTYRNNIHIVFVIQRLSARCKMSRVTSLCNTLTTCHPSHGSVAFKQASSEICAGYSAFLRYWIVARVNQHFWVLINQILRIKKDFEIQSSQSGLNRAWWGCQVARQPHTPLKRGGVASIDTELQFRTKIILF